MLATHNAHNERLDFAFHEGQRTKRLVILGHGVTGTKDSPLLTAIATALAQQEWPCLRMSFSGNGESEGKFADSTISKEVSDLSAVIDQWGADVQVAYIGYSMGAAVGTLTVARDERIKVMISLAGMVHTQSFVESTFEGITPDQGFMGDDPNFPLSSQYVDDLTQIHSTMDAVRELRLPWLLVHGLADPVIPPQDSQDLYARLRKPSHLVEIPKADHSFEGHYPQLCDEISHWLKQHLA